MQRVKQLMITGPALAFARRRVGLSQVGLARQLHIAPAVVRDWERAHDPIPQALYEALAHIIRDARLAQDAADRTQRAEEALAASGSAFIAQRR
ncbi:MAG TPA: hypothetical protein VE338_01540 [Ktedonobacterales bacterium]|jgi:DNA-binding transcriptional regulator YiaG|nr:hypothetical protein [Ktedonobacterales bacterium]